MPLRLVRRRKSPYWIIRGTVRGIRVEESSGTSDKRVAEEIRAKREAEILDQSVYGRRATVTFAEAALSYQENGGNKRFLEKVIRHFGTTPLGKIDQDAIDEGARKVYPNASAATRDRQFYTPTSAVLKHAAKRGWCAHIVMERPKKQPGRIVWITPEQAERLIAACNEYLRVLVIFLLYTGARIGEALWLDWHDVDLTRGHVTFPVDSSDGRRTKNNEPRGVPLHPRVRAALANLRHREGEVFCRPDGMPYERRRPDDANDTSDGNRIKTAFAGACKRAGIKNFTPHDLRHTWATWHYATNRDLLALQRLGGWKTLAMVTRYAHVNVGELAHTIERLPWNDSAGGNFGDAKSEKVKTA
jgi:integrase